MGRRRAYGAVGVLALLLSAGLADAQVTVSGVVRDTTGGAVGGATVDAVVADRTADRAETGEDGRYRLEAPPGVPYRIRVQREGFADFVADMEASSAPVTRDVTLRVGGVSDTVVVTASRVPENRASVTQSVTVMTSDDVAALGSQSLADVVRFVPGLAVDGTGREGAQTSLFARGGESDYNLVLIDGVRANLDGGSFDFSRLAGGEIDRVEVVRGAQSSLWGSDAMGAVVQVFTRRAGVTAEPQVTGSIEGGSFGAFRGYTGVNGGAARRVDYNAGVTYRRSDGAFADLLPEDDRFEQTAFDGGLGGALGSRASLRTSLRSSDADGRSVGPITYGSRDTGGLYETRDLSWTVTASHVAAAFTGTAAFTYFRHENESSDIVPDPAYSTYAVLEGTPDALFPDGTRLVRLIDAPEFAALAAAGAMPAPGQFLASATSFDFPFQSARQYRRPGFRYQGDVTWAEGQRFSAGWEWEREWGRSWNPPNPPPDPRTLHNNAFFVQQQFAVADRWFVTVGARADGKESYDTFFSPKLSAGGFLLPFQAGAVSSVRVFGNIGRGIKSPGFSERFGGSFADPAPDLEVEKARTADVGVEATFADQRVRGSVTFFDNEYTDQIAFRFGPVGDGVPEFINIDGSRAHGWELELALQRPLGGIHAQTSYSFVDTEVVTSLNTSQEFQSGQPLLRRPRHSGSLRLGYRVDRVSVDLDARFVGDRHDNSFLFLTTVPNAAMPAPVFTEITVNPGYTVVGLGLTVDVHDSLGLFVRADNVGDTAWDSALGYPGLPRAVVAGVRFNVAAR